MTRIAPLAPPYDPRVAEDLEKLMPPGMEPLLLFRVLAQNPRVLRRIRRGGLLDAGGVGAREREIVIARTTARCDAEYEWGVHVAFFGAAAELTPEQVRATRLDDHRAPCWSPRDALLVELADALHDRATLAPSLFVALRAHWSEAQLLELVTLAGLYHAVSFLVNAAALDPEPGTPRFPC